MMVEFPYFSIYFLFIMLGFANYEAVCDTKTDELANLAILYWIVRIIWILGPAFDKHLQIYFRIF